MQAEGADQWGNITTGIELIRKIEGKEAYGFTMPLVLDKYGNKFGKSAGNALWLDINKTSSYELYQYLVNVDDSMVISYLKIFTFLTPEEITELEKKNAEHPELREAHKALAREIITDLHGKEEYEKAVSISQSLFSGNIKGLSLSDVMAGLKDVPTVSVTAGQTIMDVLVNNKIVSSKREGREFLNAGSITLNGDKVSDENMPVTPDLAIEGKVIVLRRGKKKNYLLKF
jgi:tyrosyl-tRNA synthetase